MGKQCPQCLHSKAVLILEESRKVMAVMMRVIDRDEKGPAMLKQELLHCGIEKGLIEEIVTHEGEIDIHKQGFIDGGD